MNSGNDTIRVDLMKERFHVPLRAKKTGMIATFFANRLLTILLSYSRKREPRQSPSINYDTRQKVGIIQAAKAVRQRNDLDSFPNLPDPEKKKRDLFGLSSDGAALPSFDPKKFLTML